MKNVIRLAALVTCMLVWAPLRAEIIELKNGNKITGRLTGVTGDKLVIKTDYGEIQVPRADVVSINFPDNQAKDSGLESRRIDESLNAANYANRTAGFNATVPKGWRLAPEVRKQGKEIVAALSSGDQSLFWMVTAEPFSGTIKTYEVLVEAQLRMGMLNYANVNESASNLDGRNATEIIVHGESRAKPGTMLKFIVYIIPYEGHMIRLTFFTLEPLFDDALPIFQKIAASYSTDSSGTHLAAR